MTGGTYVTDDDLQELAGRLSEPLLAGSGRRGAILRAMQQRTAAPQGRGDLLPIPGPGQDGGGEDDSGLGELVSAITHGTLSGVLREQQARRDFARRAAMEEAKRRAEMEQFREAQRLTGLREERERQDRVDAATTAFEREKEIRGLDRNARRDEKDEERRATVARVLAEQAAKQGHVADAQELLEGKLQPSQSRIAVGAQAPEAMQQADDAISGALDRFGGKSSFGRKLAVNDPRLSQLFGVTPATPAAEVMVRHAAEQMQHVRETYPGDAGEQLARAIGDKINAALYSLLPSSAEDRQRVAELIFEHKGNSFGRGQEGVSIESLLGAPGSRGAIGGPLKYRKE